MKGTGLWHNRAAFINAFIKGGSTAIYTTADYIYCLAFISLFSTFVFQCFASFEVSSFEADTSLRGFCFL